VLKLEVIAVKMPPANSAVRAAYSWTGFSGGMQPRPPTADRMKVLHVIPSVSAASGGPSRAIVDMERALAARGIEVTTVTTNDDSDGSTLPVRCGQPIATPNATRWYFRRSTVLFKTSVGMARWLKDNVETFDVVHAHGLFSFAPVAAAFLARRADVPYVLRPLGVLAPYGMTQHHPRLKKVSLALIERRLIEAASAMHFTSRAELNEAEALGLKCRGVVIPLGIDSGGSNWESGCKRPNRTEPFELLFLSRIDPKKNIEGLMRALALVISKSLPVVLTIAGGGDRDYLSRLQSLAHALDIAGHVKWIGHVEGEKKAEALEGARAFVLPSYSENFGLAAVEALAAGLPCIVSREVAIAPDIETACAGFVVGTDAESIAAGIERLIAGGEARYSALSTAARALAVNAFSLEAMGERLEALYRDIGVLRRSGRLRLASRL
jgi:glycosyltransferase involved in cell wall biosynthesis